ncbi:MAG: LCP family protein [bacterium]
MRRTEHQDFRQGYTLVRRLLRALSSAAIPGLGQIVGGAPRRGLVMLAAAVALLIAGVVVALQGADEVLSWLVQPSVLLALIAFNVVVLGFRLFAVVDAYRLRRALPPISGSLMESQPGAGKPSAPRMAVAGAALGFVLLLTAAPHGVAGYYGYISHDLLTTVFVSEEPAQASSTSLPPTTSAPGRSTTSSAFPGTTTTAGATATDRTTSTTQAPLTTVPAVEWGEDQHLTILLVGSDAGYGRTGSRADAVMVVTVDLETGRVALFGIPRNTGDLPLSAPAAAALGTEKYANLISSLYWDALGYPELAPEGGDPGAVVLRDTVSTLLGIPIQHYAVVDMAGLVDLIDAFGGVTVNVEERVYVRMSPAREGEEWQVYDIRPGKQHLDGREALVFARSRTGTSDYSRMGRQRCVLAALLHQNSMGELVVRFPAVVKAVKNSLRTDIPLKRLPDLVKVRGELETGQTVTVGFTPPDYTSGRNRLGYNILDLELVRATVREIIEHPEKWLETQGGADADPSDCWKVD